MAGGRLSAGLARRDGPAGRGLVRRRADWV